MKKTYLLRLGILALFSINSYGQNKTVFKEDAPIQRTLQFDKKTNKEEALIGFGKQYGLDKDNTFQIIRTTSDATGMIHTRYQQFYKGVKVEFGVCITHEVNGVVNSMNGELYNAQGVGLKPLITPAVGLQKATSKIPGAKFMWDDSAQAKIMEYQKPVGELVLLPNVQTGEVKLAYKYDVFAVEPIMRDEIYVDAINGDVIFRNPIIKHAHGLVPKSQSDAYAKHIEDITVGEKSALAPLVMGSVATRYSGTQNIETTLDSSLGTYVLNDLTRGNGIVTYNSANTNTMPSTHFQDSDNVWNDGNYAAGHVSDDNAALDAQWGAMKTFDFWKNTFNRNSFDDANGQIRSYVHYNSTNNGATGWDNAQWTGSVMRYGDGDSFDVLTSVDVIGHEIGHAVCSYTAGLAYQNQSGALNEGYSDIWGACIEQYAKFGNLNAGTDTASPGTLAVWKIGEQLATNPLRSMSYPLTRLNPDTFKGTYYTTTADDGACTPNGTTNDYCGVHNNSGVFNHWFYILTAGKSGTNNASAVNGGPDVYNVTGIGMTKSSLIAYYVERDYLTPNSTFRDARNASIAVAKSVYGCGSQEHQSVTDAWYAVNVGASYNSLDVNLKSITGDMNYSCGVSHSASFVIANDNGTDGTSANTTMEYSVDGGASTPVTWVGGNLTNCTNPSQTYTINFGALSRGTHTLTVTATTTGDSDTTNNSKTISFIVNDAGTVGTVNSFATTADVLVAIDSNGTTNTLWQRSIGSKLPILPNSQSDKNGMITKISGNYPDNKQSYLVSQCYNLLNYSGASVSFDMSFDLESNWDILYFEYSIDNGATWNVLGTMADPNWYNSNRLPDASNAAEACYKCIGKQWTGVYSTAPTGGNGMNGNRRNYSHSLTSLGNPTNAIFRFNFISDEGTNRTGVFIDNFVVSGTLGTNHNSFDQFAVYPNPSKGKFNIVLSTSDNVNVQLYDMRGRSVYSKSFEAMGVSFNKEIDLNSLSSGIYILNVESNGKKEAKRIVVE